MVRVRTCVCACVRSKINQKKFQTDFDSVFRVDSHCSREVMCRSSGDVRVIIQNVNTDIVVDSCMSILYKVPFSYYAVHRLWPKHVPRRAT